MAHSIPWKTSDVLEATGGDLLSGDRSRVFDGIAIDSRKVKKNNLFVAIRGETHDGHSFIKDTIAKGVSGIVLEKQKTGDLALSEWEKNNIVGVAVSDTIKALGDLASFQRKRSKASVIAITGSNGKTTTRGITSSVMEQKFSTLSTTGNFNNEIGLPLTLFQLSNDHEWAVVELGMNQPGEIGVLGRMCSPEVGIITNIGAAHLEGVGSIEGVMKAKGELLAEIKSGGTAILNCDDPRVLKLSEKASSRVLFYGHSEKAAIRGLSPQRKGKGTVFTLSLPDEEISVNLDFPGDFMVSNALAAAAAGYLAGLSAGEIKTGIEGFQPAQGRMNILTTGQGIHIIDDTYNANPDSMKTAILTLLSLKGKQRGILVLGDMFELGKHAEAMHKAIGALAGKSDITLLYVTGNFSDAVAEGAIAEGLDEDQVITGSRESILEQLKIHLKSGDWVLIKGSRAMKMETITRGLSHGKDINA